MQCHSTPVLIHYHRCISQLSLSMALPDNCDMAVVINQMTTRNDGSFETYKKSLDAAIGANGELSRERLWPE